MFTKYIIRHLSTKARNGDETTRMLIVQLLLSIIFENLDVLAELAHKTKTPLDDKVIEFLRKLKDAGIV